MAILKKPKRVCGLNRVDITTSLAKIEAVNSWRNKARLLYGKKYDSWSKAKYRSIVTGTSLLGRKTAKACGVPSTSRSGSGSVSSNPIFPPKGNVKTVRICSDKIIAKTKVGARVKAKKNWRTKVRSKYGKKYDSWNKSFMPRLTEGGSRGKWTAKVCGTPRP